MTSAPSLPARAADTTAQRPWPVRLLSMRIGQYVDRMPALWVEGQVVDLTRRSGSSTCFLTLRDADVDMSVSVTMSSRVLELQPVTLTPGSRVVVQAKPVYWPKRGALHLEARAIRAVGEGELLARLEQLKRVLVAEGLFDASRKKPLPFLPRRVGLICGRASAAERDVTENARRRHPRVEFDVREVPLQGPDAVAAIVAAVRELDRMPAVEVIVVARGGGSFQDLLPFSNEALLRTVARAVTPVVSAIGHDVDTPLLDFVADLRASTPTDAAKRIVPDVESERGALHGMLQRVRAALAARTASERRLLESLRSRPVMRDAAALLEPHKSIVTGLRSRADVATRTAVHRARDRVGHLQAQLRTLSPAATLERGYSIVRDIDGHVITSPGQVAPDAVLSVMVAAGQFGVRVLPEVTPRPPTAGQAGSWGNASPAPAGAGWREDTPGSAAAEREPAGTGWREDTPGSAAAEREPAEPEPRG